ncbi:MAG: protein-L-isoaspartate(D-aspartate) O-methyltransferase [Verrucomicrobia bacterium]|nr:protein-L-isoaspartate(D-aspartate) O-methyltransferase [Verrucomicrobiota bacterium]
MRTVGCVVVMGAGVLLGVAVSLAAGGDAWEPQRERMVAEQIAGRDVTDGAVLRAMRRVPRHLFVPERARAEAYGDFPLPISHGQTISQPYIVAYMTQLLRLKPGAKTLEVGTGSGYQAAVLAEVTRTNVYSIEIVEPLAKTASERLKQLGYGQVVVKHGDGYLGWPEHAPFDAIIVTAGAAHVPPPLIGQLKRGGRMVIPVGGAWTVQSLVIIEKLPDGTVKKRDDLPVRFVPLTGKGQNRE